MLQMVSTMPRTRLGEILACEDGPVQQEASTSPGPKRVKVVGCNIKQAFLGLGLQAMTKSLVLGHFTKQPGALVFSRKGT